MVVSMNKDEALRLALEALGWTDEWRPQGLKEEAITAIKAALEAKDEPVTENGLYRLGYHNGYGFGEAYGKANAPQRKPLTDEEISAIDWKSNETLHDFARAIEAAHGIKGEA
jgi:hypothetical protein